MTEEENLMDLGVVMQYAVFTRVQYLQDNVLIVEAEREANSTVGTIRRKLVNRVKNTISMSYKCILLHRPHFGILHTGSHYHKPEMDKLKKVRIRAKCFNCIFIQHPSRHLGLLRGAFFGHPRI